MCYCADHKRAFMNTPFEDYNFYIWAGKWSVVSSFALFNLILFQPCMLLFIYLFKFKSKFV